GGFPANSINVIMGQPGTGKTIFAEQMLFHNARGDRPMLYLTTLSEPMAKAMSYVQRFRFFDAAKLGSVVMYDDLGALLAQQGPQALVARLKDEIKTHSPQIIVIDSYRAIHDLATSRGEMRRVITELAGLLSAYETTTFLLGEYTREDIPQFPEFAVADSIVELARSPLSTRDERFFRVLKLRGSEYREGQHAFRITDAGLDIYPRLVSPPMPKEYRVSRQRMPWGVSGLDPLIGGGLWQGSTTLLLGPTGSGKTTMALQFALEGFRRGEPALYVNFQENPSQLRRLIADLGTDVDDAERQGLHLLYKSPVELQIDSIIVEIFALMQSQGIRRVVVDAVGDLSAAATDPQRLHDYLYALEQHFAVRGVTSVLTLESEVDTGAQTRHTPQEQQLSYMSDNVLLLSLPTAERSARTLRVIKTRRSPHEPGLHTFEIGHRGVRVI
ncbi:MAG TPA: ATPase domain-containing protein, partial [Gemmatimonadaceae bacterium]|nr:ATPase domain-containing protein [Gemmatimonadaceae bacterium]